MLYMKGNILSNLSTEPAQQDILYQFIEHYDKLTSRADISLIDILSDGNLVLKLLYQIAEYLLFDEKTPLETIEQHIGIVDALNMQVLIDLAKRLVANQQSSQKDNLLSNTDKTLIHISDMMNYATNQMILHALIPVKDTTEYFTERYREFQKKSVDTETVSTITDLEYFGIENPLVIAIAALYKQQVETPDPIFQRFIAIFDALEQPLFITLRSIIPFILWQEEDPQTTNTRLKTSFNALLRMKPEELGELMVYHPHILATALYHYHIRHPKEADLIVMGIDQIFSLINPPSCLQQQGYFYFLIHIHNLQQSYYVGITEDRLENIQTKLSQLSAPHSKVPKPFFCILEKNTATLHKIIMGQTLSIPLSSAQAEQLGLILPKIEDQTRPSHACIEKIREYSGCALHFNNLRDVLINYCLNKNFYIQPELQIHIQSPDLFYNDFLLAFAIALANCPTIIPKNKQAIFTQARNTNPPSELVTGWWTALKIYPLLSKRVLYPDLSDNFIQAFEKFETFWGNQFFKHIAISTKNLAVYLDLLSAWYPALGSNQRSINTFLLMYATYAAELCHNITPAWKPTAHLLPISIPTLFKNILQLSLEHQALIFKNLIHITPELQKFMLAYSPQIEKVYALDAGKFKDLPQQLARHLDFKKNSFPRLHENPCQLPTTIATPEFACAFFILLSIANQSFTTKPEQKMYASWKTFLMAALIDILKHHAQSEIGLIFQEMLQISQVMPMLPEHTQKQFLWEMFPDTAKYYEKLLLDDDQKSPPPVKKTPKKRHRMPKRETSPEFVESAQSSSPPLIDTPHKVLQLVEVLSPESAPTPMMTLSPEVCIDLLTPIQETFGRSIHHALQQFIHLQKQIHALPKTSAVTPVSEKNLKEKWTALLDVMHKPLSLLFPFSKPLLQQKCSTTKQALPDSLDAKQIENTWNPIIVQLQTIIENMLRWEHIQEDKQLMAELSLCHTTLTRGGYYRHPHRYLPEPLLSCLETINTWAAEHGFQMFVKGSTCLSENTLTAQQDIDLVFFQQSKHYTLLTINAFVDRIRASLEGESKAIHSNPDENYYQMRVNIPISAEQSCSSTNTNTIAQDMDWTFLLTPELDPMAYTQKALVSPAAILWDIQTGRQWMLAKTAAAIFHEPRIFCLISENMQSVLISNDKIGYLCKQWITHAHWQMDPVFQAKIIDPFFAQSTPDLTADGQERTQQLLQATLRYLLVHDRFKASFRDIIHFINQYQLLIKAYPWEKNAILAAQKIPHACEASFLKYFYPALHKQNSPTLSPIEFIALYCIAGILDKPPMIKEAMIDFLKGIQKTLPVKFEPLLKMIVQAPQTSYEWNLLASMNRLQAHSGSTNAQWGILLTYWHMPIEDFLPSYQQAKPIPLSSSAMGSKPIDLTKQARIEASSTIDSAHKQQAYASQTNGSRTLFFQKLSPPFPVEQPKLGLFSTTITPSSSTEISEDAASNYGLLG